MNQKRDNACCRSWPDQPTGKILHFRKDGNPRKCYDEAHGNLRGRATMHGAVEDKNAEYLQRCGEVLNILSNAKRVEVVLALSKNEQSVKQLAHQVDLSQSALSQHLAKMREAGVVETRRHGLVVYYRLIMPELIGLLKEVVLFVKTNSKKA
ncbi:metalloregulator ArsR/SmtB family transcription factor [Agrobacterium sp. CR_3]|uniref:ArsR/SmtB family transcription factor n=1 Tax=Agrobacterium TaxID=357 RepID=UPI0018C21EEE|nr:metalloregulator ArsR/SmtB family transcription factor [Agrobacterium leguminum]MBG0508787.1 winged helix-turn-helix transcriptional regulator [Agrobacterium leguminum]